MTTAQQQERHEKAIKAQSAYLAIENLFESTVEMMNNAIELVSDAPQRRYLRQMFERLVFMSRETSKARHELADKLQRIKDEYGE